MKTGDDHMEGFAMRLTQLRKKKGYTQAQLADKIGVTNKSVSRWERGEGYPDISVLPALADALSLSLIHILYGCDWYRIIFIHFDLYECIFHSSRIVENIGFLIYDGRNSILYRTKIKALYS